MWEKILFTLVSVFTAAYRESIQKKIEAEREKEVELKEEVPEQEPKASTSMIKQEEIPVDKGVKEIMMKVGQSGNISIDELTAMQCVTDDLVGRQRM